MNTPMDLFDLSPYTVARRSVGRRSTPKGVRVALAHLKKTLEAMPPQVRVERRRRFEELERTLRMR